MCVCVTIPACGLVGVVYGAVIIAAAFGILRAACPREEGNKYFVETRNNKQKRIVRVVVWCFLYRVVKLFK